VLYLRENPHLTQVTVDPWQALSHTTSAAAAAAAATVALSAAATQPHIVAEAVYSAIPAPYLSLTALQQQQQQQHKRSLLRHFWTGGGSQPVKSTTAAAPTQQQVTAAVQRWLLSQGHLAGGSSSNTGSSSDITSSSSSSRVDGAGLSEALTAAGVQLGQLGSKRDQALLLQLVERGLGQVPLGQVRRPRIFVYDMPSRCVSGWVGLGGGWGGGLGGGWGGRRGEGKGEVEMVYMGERVHMGSEIVVGVLGQMVHDELFKKGKGRHCQAEQPL
jgi:hypothetical protein